MNKFSIEWWQSLSPHQIGNEVEGMVEKVLKDFNTRLAFAWHRLSDTKSARLNAIAAQPADYVYRCGDNAGFIEVKALGHPYRLPKGNLSQLPTLRKWAHAGSNDVILVHHYLQGHWRALLPLWLDPGEPSWDLREFAYCYTAEEALKSTQYFGSIDE